MCKMLRRMEERVTLRYGREGEIKEIVIYPTIAELGKGVLSCKMLKSK